MSPLAVLDNSINQPSRRRNLPLGAGLPRNGGPTQVTRNGRITRKVGKSILAGMLRDMAIVVPHAANAYNNP